MSKDDWLSFMKLMRTLPVQAVFRDPGGTRVVVFKIEEESIGNGDSAKGIFYSETTPENLVSDLDDYGPSQEVLASQRSLTAHKQIKDHWYLYQSW